MREEKKKRGKAGHGHVGGGGGRWGEKGQGQRGHEKRKSKREQEPKIFILDLSTYLKDKEPSAASKANNVPDMNSTVSAGWDASFVEESAMGTSQIIEIKALPTLIRVSAGIRPSVL